MGSRGSCFRSDLVDSALKEEKKDFESNFETDPLRPAVVMVKLLGAPGRVEGKVDVYMRSSMQRL